MKRISKKQALFVILFVILMVTFLCSCSDVYFPPKEELPTLAFKDTVLNNKVSYNEINRIDFYIQGTKYMRGFIACDTYKSIPGHLLDTANALWRDKDKAFFRFDYSTRHTDDYPLSLSKGKVPFAYWIDQIQFTRDFVIDASCYDFMWYTTQEGKGRLSYELDSNGDYGDFDNDYLATTISNLDRDNLSIVITDLVDSSYSDGEKLHRAMREYTEGGNAISVVQIISKFEGDIYLPSAPDKTSSYDGSRPLYILVFGNQNDSSSFLCELKKRLPDSTEMDSTKMDSTQSDSTEPESTQINYLPMCVIAEESLEPLIVNKEEDGLRGLLNDDVARKEKENIGFDERNTLYYRITDDKANIAVTLKMPFADYSKKPFSKVKIEPRLFGIKEGTSNAYEELSPAEMDAAVIVDKESSTIGGNAHFNVTFIRQGLKEASFSEGVVKLALILELRVIGDDGLVNRLMTHAGNEIDGSKFEEDKKAEYYGERTVSLDETVNGLWHAYNKRLYDEHVANLVIYIKE